jgi:hypothetical protein
MFARRILLHVIFFRRLVRMHPANPNDADAQKDNDPERHGKINFRGPPANVDQRLTVVFVETHRWEIITPSAREAQVPQPFGRV